MQEIQQSNCETERRAAALKGGRGVKAARGPYVARAHAVLGERARLISTRLYEGRVISS